MIHSMTGYGEASGENDLYRISATLKSVNHRYLDLAVRLVEPMRASEAALRGVLAERLSRGRVEIGVSLQPIGALETRLVIDREALRALHREFGELEHEGLISRGLTASDLLASGTLARLEIDSRWTEPDERLLLDVTAQALDALIAARADEGAKLDALLRGQLAALEATAERLVEARESSLAEIREGLAKRLDDLLDGVGVDPQRLAQEVAVLVDRSDVTEEIDRLRAHLTQARQELETGEAVGKRLDFLAQEIFRELNTIGSKCRNADMTRVVVDGKSLCEQFREQVQNVE